MLFFSGLGYQNSYQAKIWIYDICNNLVSKGCTFNGRYSFKGCMFNAYKIKIISYLGIMGKNIFVNNNSIYVPLNGRRKERLLPTRFRLTDYFYDNLPINRGELILWRK